MDSISDLIDGGIEDLVLSAISVVSVATILLFLDWKLALVTLISFPFLIWLSRWFQQAVGEGVPADPRDGRTGDRAVRRVDGRHPGGADVPS